MSEKQDNNLFSWFKNIKKKTSNIKKKLFNPTIKNIESIKKNNLFNTPKNFLKKIYLGFKDNKNSFAYKIKQFFMYQEVNDIFFKKLEDTLLMYDFGYAMTDVIIKMLTTGYKKNIFKNKKELYIALKKFLFDIINIETSNLYNKYNKLQSVPNIILIAGVNGVGKTTIIAKLAHLYKKIGYSVMLSAGDTFRAAAIDQLKLWGEKINIPVFYKTAGTDPSAVIFDSIKYAKEKNIDILLIDTAGRLHNKLYLMEELKKNIRVINHQCLYAPQEIFLVLDACNGQNSINQIEIFYKTIKKITGIILTKLDGTSKGGIVFSIVNKFHIPIKYLGTGEKLEDLYQFNSIEFINTFFEQ